MTPATLDPAERRGIGASQISQLFGVSAYGGALSLYQSIVHPDDWRDEGNAVQRRGTRLEPYVIAEYAARRNLPVVDGPPPSGGEIPDGIYDAGTQRHPDVDFLIASADGVEFQGGELVRFVEAKTSRDRSGWMDPDEVPDGAPLAYLLQTQLQMACGVLVDGRRHFAPEAVIPAIIGSLDDYREYIIPRDRTVEMQIIGVGGAFWVDHIETRSPPEWDGSEAGNKVLRGMFPTHRAGDPERVDNDHEARAMACAVGDAREVAKDRKVNDEEVFQRARAMVGDGPGFAGRGWKLTWNQNKDSVKTDWEALALMLLRDGGWQPEAEATEREETQALIDKFTTTKPGARVLRATFK